MLPAIVPRPRFGALILVMIGSACVWSATWLITCLSWSDPPYTHRYRYSAFGAIHDAFCGPDSTRIIPNALQHDRFGNPYLFECNPRGFTVVSAGEDGVYDTADDVRSDR